MSSYRLVKPDNKNIFYETLATISTLGIITITGIQVSNVLNQDNLTQDQLGKYMIEIKNARTDALAEMTSMREEVLKDLNTFKSKTLSEVTTNNRNILEKVETAQNTNLAEVKISREKILNELRGFECLEE